jgi:hypothetical protein
VACAEPDGYGAAPVGLAKVKKEAANQIKELKRRNEAVMDQAVKGVTEASAVKQLRVLTTPCTPLDLALSNSPCSPSAL